MTSKHFQIGLVVGYIIFYAVVFFWILKLFGVHMSFGIMFNFTCAWALFCFLSHWFTADYYLFGHLPARKPILKEEQRLKRLLGEIQEKSAFTKKMIRLWVLEQKSFNAFAVGRRSIGVSRGIMEQFSDGEMKGILSHELGHLHSMDTTITATFLMTENTAGSLYYICQFLATERKKKTFIVRLLLKILRLAAFIFLFATLIFLYRHRHLSGLAAVILYIYLYPKILRIFIFFWRAVSRFNEYKQDAYAHSLSYGTELLQAMHKLISEEGEPVNLYENMMRYDHPVIYNRIRRLEKLEGLR